MPFDGNVWSGTKLVSYADMLAAVTSAYPQGLERCLDPRGEVAKNFRVSTCGQQRFPVRSQARCLMDICGAACSLGVEGLPYASLGG